MKRQILISIFIFFLIFFLYESFSQIYRNLQERNYYEVLFWEYKDKLNNLKTNLQIDKSIKLIDSWWVVITINNFEKTIRMNELEKDLVSDKNKNKEEILNLDNVDYSNAILYIPWYIEKEKKVPLVFPKNNTTIYSDLKKWIRVSTNAQKPHETGITFIEWHSWQNYIWASTFSFFDNLALYYDNLNYNLPIYIETDNYIFKYTLFKKEIITPWEKDFYQSEFHHLILMTCYPRNTSQKRALLHWKLISITKK